MGGLLIRCQLQLCRFFNGFLFAHEEMAGANAVLRCTRPILANAVVDLTFMAAPLTGNYGDRESNVVIICCYAAWVF